MGNEASIETKRQLDSILLPEVTRFVFRSVGAAANRHLTSANIKRRFTGDNELPREGVSQVQQLATITNEIIDLDNVSANLQAIKSGIEQPGGKVVVSLYYRSDDKEIGRFGGPTDIAKGGADQVRIILRSPLRVSRGEVYAREAIRGKSPEQIVPRTLDELKGWELVLHHDRLGYIWDRLNPVSIACCKLTIVESNRTGNMEVNLTELNVGRKSYVPNA